MKFFKKGDIEFEMILKLLLALIVILVIIGLIILIKKKSLGSITNIFNILRFGT
ncbi:MAG TPA: hypothetical protein VJG30_02975 [Candidatus Nanoarchaeia archaeon]|nr:hypothetical protein [Candidatus Nanoarchaeia archaeon]